MQHPKSKTKNTDALVSHLSWSVLWLLLVCGVISSCSTTRKQPTQKWVKKYPKQARRILNDFRYVDSGRLTMGLDNNIVATENDSTLLVSNYEHTEYVPAFYISDHEVTNAEYREFTNWVRDSIALSLVAQADPSFYLDKEKKILDWGKRNEIWDLENDTFLTSLYYPTDPYFKNHRLDNDNFIYKYQLGNETVSIKVYPVSLLMLATPGDWYFATHDFYKENSFYDKYPILGVSWNQANAYCHWKTQQVSQILSKKQKYNVFPRPTFRLPSEAEWEKAAYGIILYSFYESEDSRRIFPWKSSKMMNKKGDYLANFGMIYDNYGFQIKHSGEDDFFYHSKVKSFPANDYKLFDMAGNVAEWTSDIPRRVRMINGNRCGEHNWKWPIINSIDNRPRFWTYEQALAQYSDSLKRTLLDSLMSTMKEDFRPAYQKWVVISDSINNILLDSFRITAKDSLASAYQKMLGMENLFTKIMELADPLYGNGLRIQHSQYWRPNLNGITALAAAELHDAKVLAAHNNLRIVKGGSWATGPAYMLCSSREVFPENKCSSRIGFRLVMDK